MELQKLIDGLKAHKSGAASYESVDEAIRVFEAMRDVDGEKVVKGLERFRADFKPFVGNSCDWERVDAAISLIRQQQERIKELEAAQTARVMTLEELDVIYQTREQHTWPFNAPPYLWMTVNPDVRQTRGFWICWRDIKYSLENDSQFYVRENYGKVWKIWTAEPTDEQRKAVKWNG